MSIRRHALNRRTSIYCNKILPNVTLETQASKTLAFKWFQDWKKYQKIQPGKSYAQALILGRETNPCTVYSKPRQHKVTPKQTSNIHNGRMDRGSKKSNHTVPVKTNTSTGLQSGGSVAGTSRATNHPVQIQLKNRFQVFQDTLNHELGEHQRGQIFADTDKQAKSHTTQNMAPISKTVSAPLPKSKIQKQLHSTSLQQTQNSQRQSHTLLNLHRDDDMVDIDRHRTDYQPAINRNCEPDNNLIPQSSPKNIKNFCGTAINPGMCSDHQKCIEQTGGYFGFVPQTSLKVYQGSVVNWENIPTTLEAHKLVRSSGTHNYLKCRIPVNSHLKIDNWTYFLKDYWDKQIVDLHYGFPLDFNRNSPLTSTYDNHTSANTDIEHVRQYVKEELQHQAIIGPFDTVPCTLHLSPLMTRAKQDSHKKRTIMDLSWPIGQSVNAGVQKDIYLDTIYSLHYPSIDNITEALLKLGPAAKLYKVDISRAFCHLRVDPADIDLLGFQVDGHYFTDVSTPFGFRHGSLFFQRCSDTIRYIMASHGCKGLFNYIDDLKYIGLPSEIQHFYQFFVKITAETWFGH